MSLQREPRRFSIEEYLWLESQSEAKSEYQDGQIFAMSGGTLDHNRIVRNLLRAIDEGLGGKRCEVFPSDLRLYVKRHSILTYPDLTVVCGAPKLMPGRKDTLVDATMLVEVLSPSTSEYVRGDKFRFYRSLTSFAEFLAISQDEVRIEHHQRRKPGQWVMTEHLKADAVIELTSVGIQLAVGKVYSGTSLTNSGS